jgi:nucleotide-binding universal stress UspA family protein
MSLPGPETVVVCVDDSDLSLHAAVAGFALLQPARRVIVTTVAEHSDPLLVTGSGMAGGVMSAAEAEEIDDSIRAEAGAVVQHAIDTLEVEGAEPVVLHGDPGRALCDLAAEVNADAIVMGSRGRGGIKRALLGSVSDHVVRNAPCTVIITGPRESS